MKFLKKSFPHIPSKIIIILISLATLLLIINYFFKPNDGLALNVATEIIGILVTVWLIDYIIFIERKSKTQRIISSVRHRFNSIERRALTVTTLIVSNAIDRENISETDDVRKTLIYAIAKTKFDEIICKKVITSFEDLLPRLTSIIEDINYSQVVDTELVGLLIECRDNLASLLSIVAINLGMFEMVQLEFIEFIQSIRIVSDYFETNN